MCFLVRSFGLGPGRRSVIALALSVVASSAAAAADDDAIKLAATHLLEAQLPSGLLAYDFDFVTRTPSSKDNIVRQAGVIAFLAEYYAQTRDARARSAVETGLTTLVRLSVPIARGTLQSLIESSGLLSPPVGRRTVHAALDRLGLLYRRHGEGRLVTTGGDYGAALTGATALALIAELQYYGATHDDRFRDARSAWLNGLLALHRPRRGFRSSPALIEESPFFNGESWLALALYYRIDPADASVRELLKQLDSYLMATYENDVETGFYQWGTMAAGERFETTSDRRFLDFMRGQATKVDESLSESPMKNSCSVVEGLATAAGLLSRHQGYEGIATKIALRVEQEMARNRHLQIPADAHRLPLGRDIYLLSPDLTRFAGAFLAGGSPVYTRIDVTGHCLAAMVKVRRYRVTRGDTSASGRVDPKRNVDGGERWGPLWAAPSVAVTGTSRPPR